MAKIFLTGASGYLGSSLIPYFPKDWEIVAYGRSAPAIKMPKNTIFERGDICGKISPKIMEGIDAIIHLAAIKGSGPASQNPKEAMKTNVDGTRNLILLAKETGVKRFLFASTYLVYGEDCPLPCKEEWEIPAESATDVYGKSKLISENDLQASGLDYSIMRLTNIFGYGSGIKFDEVISTFISRSIEGKPMVLYNRGKQKRDFLYINDFCNIVPELAFNKKAGRQIINTGSGRVMSVAQAAEVIKETMARRFGIDAKIEMGPDVDMAGDKYVSVEKLMGIMGNFEFTTFESAVEELSKKLKKRIN